MSGDPWAEVTYKDAPPPTIRGFGPSPYAEWANGYNAALAAVRPFYDAERARAERWLELARRAAPFMASCHQDDWISDLNDALVAEQDR